MDIVLADYIGRPINDVKSELENQGVVVNVIKNSKPKIKTDYELVVSVKSVGDNKVDVIVGDFLVNIEDRDGLV